MTNISNNDWIAAKVERIIEETPNVKTYSFKLPVPAHHIAGQHYELQLGAENGYKAARPYSAASAAQGMPLVELTVQKVPDGEVSEYLYDALKIGDEVEIRGPFGKFFTWDDSITQPTLLIAGGSGVVPMHSILASHAALQSDSKIHLVYSARTSNDIIYKELFKNNPQVTITLTKEMPALWNGAQGRINTELFKKVLEQFDDFPLCYVCGMSSFVSTATDILQELNIPIENIKTERFG